LNRIRLKFETTAIDSNFMHLDAKAMKPLVSHAKGPAAGVKSGGPNDERRHPVNTETAFEAHKAE
jgi:hypothetical protein